MATPNEVGAMIAAVKARTGMTWAEVADVIGTTPTYARKLASGVGKFGAEGAGRALRGNLTDFQRTGEQQTPVQRVQRVRAPGGATRAATPRAGAVAPAGKSQVTRSVYRGGTRDGWAAHVTVPARDREAARWHITEATRRAAMGHRRIAFRVTVRTPDGSRTVDVGGTGSAATGYDARRALAGMKTDGTLDWLVSQGLDRYQGLTDDVEWQDIEAVEVIALA